MTQEEKRQLERCIKALEGLRASGPSLKALGFVLGTLEDLVEKKTDIFDLMAEIGVETARGIQ